MTSCFFRILSPSSSQSNLRSKIISALSAKLNSQSSIFPSSDSQSNSQPTTTPATSAVTFAGKVTCSAIPPSSNPHGMHTISSSPLFWSFSSSFFSAPSLLPRLSPLSGSTPASLSLSRLPISSPDGLTGCVFPDRTTDLASQKPADYSGNPKLQNIDAILLLQLGLLSGSLVLDVGAVVVQDDPMPCLAHLAHGTQRLVDICHLHRDVPCCPIVCASPHPSLSFVWYRVR